MKITVVMPCFNKQDVTDRSVQSYIYDTVVFGDQKHELSFVFVDNGSTDGTAEYLKRVPNSVVITNETNLGVGKAWDQGLHAAREQAPDIVILSNNDVLMGHNWMCALVREIECGGKHYYLPNGNYRDVTTFYDESRRAMLEFTRETEPGRSGWCMAFPRGALDMFLPVPEELFLFHQDDYIHESLADDGWDCRIIKAWPALHIDQGSITVKDLQREDLPDARDAVIEQDKVHWKRICGEKLWGPTNIDAVKRIADLAVELKPAKTNPLLKDLENVGTSEGLYYDFLHLLVHKMRPRPLRIVEIGTYRGVSAACMAAAAAPYEPQGEVVTIDIHLEGDARDRLSKYGNVMLIQKHSHWVPRVLPFTSPWIDLLFIDGEHSYAQAIEEFHLYEPMVRTGGVIVCDDIHLNEEMNRFWDELPEPKLSLPGLHHTGFGALVKV